MSVLATRGHRNVSNKEPMVNHGLTKLALGAVDQEHVRV